MLSKKEIEKEVCFALGVLGRQLHELRIAARKNIATVSRETGLLIKEIDEIESWNANVLNLENVIRLCACYNKRLFLDLYTEEEIE